MKHYSKLIILNVATCISLMWKILPSKIRELLITGLLILESRGDAAKGMGRLFKIKDRLDWVINERAMEYGCGVHPKHRLIKYHDYFIERIEPGSKVLDVGCGHGVVSRSIATRVKSVTVVGVELSKKNFDIASSGIMQPNLRFVNADARDGLPKGHWDVVVLSNVLEHIEDRVEFLRDIISQAKPNKILIRVPLFERDWMMAMRKEIGVNYFSDDEHYIEHSLIEFSEEMKNSGLKLVDQVAIWGEIWSECELIK